MFKTIVCGVDATPTAAAAARKAAELAQLSGARLWLVSAYGTFHEERFASGGEEFTFTTAKDSQRTAEQVAADLLGVFPSLEVITLAAEGNPGEALVRVARVEDADLIVVGNRRVQGFARILGSIAGTVAAQAHCDMYLVHTHGG